MSARAGLLALALVVCTSCTASDDSSIFAIRYDPCERLSLEPAADALPEELDSIRDAIAMWNLAAETQLSEASPAADSELPIRFEDAAPVFFGVYEKEIGEVVINRRLMSRTPRAITIAHEIGHAFGLEHVDDRPSLMSPGNLEITPTVDDVTALFALWGDCGDR